MKYLKIITTAILLSGVLFSTSCKKWIDPAINESPNDPLNAPLNLLLPSVQGALGYVMGGDVSRTTSLWTQHHAGIDRQSIGMDNYVLNEGDVDNAWRFNLYGGPMTDLKIMMDKADAAKALHYKGIAQVLMAYTLGVTTDLWGDVPYSEALKGQDNLHPKYDTQESIYTAMQTMLTDAVKNLKAPAGDIEPGGDDLMYGGDASLWLGFANTLRARYYLHLAKQDAGNYAKAIAALKDGAIADNSGDANITFGSTEPEGNPWYQFMSQRGDIAMGKAFIDLMNGMNDPRLPVYAEVNDSGEYAGSAAGDPTGNVSTLGAYYTSINSPVPLATYVEAMFIDAEAKFQTGDKAGAAASHNAAVIASLDRFSVTDSAYIKSQASEDASTITLDKIMTQKYIALYTQFETFNDWRRTGIPALTAAKNNSTGGAFPRRFPYPLSERLNNAANYKADPGKDLTKRVWWDK